jgi:hypothetical protein
MSNNEIKRQEVLDMQDRNIQNKAVFLRRNFCDKSWLNVQVEGTGDVVISLEEEKNTVHHYKISKVFHIEIITTTEENTGSFLPPPYLTLTRLLLL